MIRIGIIFTGGENPAPDIVKRLIETETEGNVLFIAADSGLTAAEKAGIEPDWLIGDFDSLHDTSSLASYPEYRIIRHGREKDFTDTELALTLAIEKGCDDIWLIGGGGGRIDHLFGIRSMFERDVFPSRWITAHEDIFCIEAGLNTGNTNLHILNKLARTDGNVGNLVSVFPLGSGPWEATSEGLNWKLSGLPWNRGFFGLSNVTVSDEFSITAQLGRFMIILQLDDE